MEPESVAAGLSVQSLHTARDQSPGRYGHLCIDSFNRLLTEVAAPNLNRSPIGPRQAGLTVFSRGAEEPDNPGAAVCASLALLHKHIFLIYAKLQPHSGSLPLG